MGNPTTLEQLRLKSDEELALVISPVALWQRLPH